MNNETDIKLLPYVSINGEFTLSAEIIAGFWNQLCEESTAGIVFPDGHITTAQSFTEFLQMEKNLPAFAFIDNKIVGLAWLNSVVGKHAFGHFAFLKSIWGKHTVAVGKSFINYWFMLPGATGGYMFDVILGMVPASNERATRFIERIGFKKVGVIPSMLYNAEHNEYMSAQLSYIQR